VALFAAWRNRVLARRGRNLLLEVDARTRSLAAQTLQLERANRQLSDLAHRDGLTGVANRRRLDAQMAEFARDDVRYCLIFLDLDHFKRYNDHFGHLAGDDLLRRCSESMQIELGHVTSDALLARYGGEEFAVVLPRIELNEAMDIANALRLGIERACSDAAMTASAGVARTNAQPSDNATADVIARADAALYRAKAAGRNRVLS
jgi:diguanylate cyclase (GGDEF)-like protein